MSNVNKARHAFGSSDKISDAIANGLIDAYDILFLDGDTNPKVGWIDSKGEVRIVREEDEVVIVDGESLPDSGEVGKIYVFGEDAYVWKSEVGFVNLCKPTDVSALETQIAEHEAEILTKASAEEVECSYEKIKYEIDDAPIGTLIDYKEDEIRIMCKSDAKYHLQGVGTGGDANTYYVTLKVYAPSDDAVGYVEHLGDQVDSEILTSFSVNKYGKRYQPTWLGVAKYDKDADTWSYYGANSTTSKYIGWDYQIDWYNADNVMIASDSVRINLSNEGCHYAVEPYYIGKTKAEIEETVTNTVEEKVAKAVEDAVAIEVIEF